MDVSEENEMNYRKKPVVIDAVQWDGTYLHAKELEAALGLKTLGMDYHAERNECSYWRISTLEDGHVVSPLDWIITGVKGEHYPCKPDVFAATYEPADAALSEGTVPLYAAPLASVEAQSRLSEARDSHVLVPLRLTQEMRDVMDQEGWQWEDLLAAANAISEEQYIAAHAEGSA